MRKLVFRLLVAACGFLIGIGSFQIWRRSPTIFAMPFLPFQTLRYCEVARNAEHYHNQNIRVFLSESWRLHRDVCKFTSEVFYDGRLMSRPENERQRLNTQGPLDITGSTGLLFAPVNHGGNQSQSPEEVARVVELVNGFLRDGTTWTTKSAEVAPLLLKDILIIAPYNAQVSALARSLPAGARVGTVDKVQGQEAPVVIYSMSTSTAEDAPRGMEFLYSSNRLNVATSRAQCLTVLVACPALFEVQCKTPRQMELANAFCRYLEMAQVS